MSIDQIRSVVEAAIQKASSATGVDFTFLLGAARRESGFNPAAKARTSSATGLFQFTDQTWLATLKQHGAKHGYARYAALIEQGSGGRYHVAGSEARTAVMDLRFDAHASALMAGELAAAHAAYLRGRVGREPTAGELYAAHVLGSAGSAKLIDAMRTAPLANAAALFPREAGANRSIFFPGGKAATVSDVYANLTAGPGAAVPELRSGETDQGFVQYASARRADQQRMEQEVVDLVLRGPQGADDVGPGLRLSHSLFSSELLRALSDSAGGTSRS